jgi:hypothetical protein
VKVVFRADVYPGPPYDKVAVISGEWSSIDIVILLFCSLLVVLSRSQVITREWNMIVNHVKHISGWFHIFIYSIITWVSISVVIRHFMLQGVEVAMSLLMLDLWEKECWRQPYVAMSLLVQLLMLFLLYASYYWKRYVYRTSNYYRQTNPFHDSDAPI